MDRHIKGFLLKFLVTFTDGAFLSYHSVRIHVGDINGKVPPSTRHAPSHRHTQGVIWLLCQTNCLLIACRLLTRVLHRGQRDSESEVAVKNGHLKAKRHFFFTTIPCSESAQWCGFPSLCVHKHDTS